MSRFEVIRVDGDQYHCRMRGDNGEIVAISEMYNDKSSAVHWVELLHGDTADIKLIDNRTPDET